jgi:iron(III) transport system ATP-binding protein
LKDVPQDTPRPYLSIRGLSTRFGSFVALRDIDFDIAEGEFVCFLGPSGCGKTTLLRTIAGLTHQSEGAIWLGGRDISHLPIAERDFGIVFQSYALFPNLTVAANVGYSLAGDRRFTRESRAARVRELLELVGLPDAGDKYPAQLSGGQQQRVALARALCNSPGLLLLDEPLSALDALVRQRLRLEIKALQSRLGVTTILVTHDQEEALTMADRIVVMNDSVIEQIGTPQDIYYRPASLFVAGFIGAMNMMGAEVDGSGTLATHGLSLTTEQPLQPGSRVTICVRPEEVRLLKPDENAENMLDVRIAAVEFLGSLFRCETEPTNGIGPPLAIELPTATIRDLELKPGTQIRASLPPAKLRIFPRHENEPRTSQNHSKRNVPS